MFYILDLELLKKTNRLIIMKICTWNVNKATDKKQREDVWKYFLEMDTDIAFLQEVNSIPKKVLSNYECLSRNALKKNYQNQDFSTAILVRGSVNRKINFSSPIKWVDEELKCFVGHLVGAEITLPSGKSFNVVSVYIPYWSIPKERLKEDVSEVKLKQARSRVWVKEIFWQALLNENLNEHNWIIGGDLNASVTLDKVGENKIGKNKETLNRIKELGFLECLEHSQGKLTPTFKKNGEIKDQIDHLFIPKRMETELLNCEVGDKERVFGGTSRLSDHLPIIATLK